jgi:hypothetical protein
MTAVSSVQDANAVTGRPTRISKKGFQFHIQRQALAPSLDTAQTLSFVAWEPSTGSLNGLVFEVSKTGQVKRDQFSTIAFQETFPGSPVFLADLQASGGGSPLNLRWERKDLSGIDVKIDAVQDLERDNAEPQDVAVVGYILIR